jgi:hypothetical protein
VREIAFEQGLTENGTMRGRHGQHEQIGIEPGISHRLMQDTDTLAVSGYLDPILIAWFRNMVPKLFTAHVEKRLGDQRGVRRRDQILPY